MKRKRKPKTADVHASISILDEALQLLQGAGLRAWVWYLAGSIPFGLGLIWYVSLMSESGRAGEQVFSTALPLPILYGWMKVCQSRFAVALWQQHGQEVRMDKKRFRGLIFRQCVLQPYGLIMVQLSHLFIVPYVWVAGYFQSLSVCEVFTSETDSVHQQAMEAAKYKIGNVLPILLAAKPALFLLVALNWLTVFIVVPYLLYSFTGIENPFVKSSAVFMSPGFWMTVAMFTFMTVDPLLKAFYLLRAHYAASRKTGEDLRQELVKIQQHKSGKLLLGLCVLGCLSWGTPSLQVRADEGVEISHLDEVLSEVSQQEKYLWRLPPDYADLGAQDLNPVESWLKKTAESIGHWLDASIDALIDWWEVIFDKPNPEARQNGGAVLSKLESVAKLLLVLLIAVIVIAVIVVIVKAVHRRRIAVKVQPSEEVAAQPDLNDEDVLASDLPPDEWLDLVREMQQKGEWRLALRALFLAFLSRLEEQRLLVIRRSKSNREYEVELGARGLQDPELLPFYKRFRSELESVWYGDYPVEQAQVEALQTWVEKWGRKQ